MMISKTTQLQMIFAAFLLLPLSCEGNTKIHGRYTRDITDYEKVIPVKVTENGEFDSYLLPKFYSASEASRKREVDELVHYKVPIRNEEYHVVLSPNRELFSPGMAVETRGPDIKIKRAADNMHCHYTGYVKGKDGYKVALSACHGLSGYIKTDNGTYMIEPIENHDPRSGVEHPHLVTKRYDDGFSNCAVKESLAEAINRRLAGAEDWSKPKKYGVDEVKVRYLETAVVLDWTFLNYHKKLDVDNYVMTVMNMMYNMFHDQSVGALIHVSVVRIVKLEEQMDEMNLKVSKNCDTTLDNFCKWQKMINPTDDSHPNHHDVAVLLTRTDLCDPHDGSCSILGIAKMGGTCDPDQSCAVCEDSGLKLGYVITHEVGHTLGVQHDTPEIGCDCNSPVGGHTVMCPGVHPDIDSWSKCSENFIAEFIKQGLGECLLDPPSDYGYKIDDVLPGVMYDGDYQCQSLLKRPTTQQCRRGRMCKQISCTVGKHCVSLNAPAMPGTKCGNKKWCYNRKCLRIGRRPGAVDGGWSEWSEWSQCSRTCDSGVSYSERSCNNPQPANGGKYCVGEKRQYRICETTPCDPKKPSFREVQCASHSDKIFPMTGKKHQFTAVEKHKYNPCTLYCAADNQLYLVQPKVIDGTTCYRGFRDICINGMCVEVPCDHDLTSSAKEDACGVCHGDGTSCDIERGEKSFEKKLGALRFFFDIPEGAMNIRVEETHPTECLIVVKLGKKSVVPGRELGIFEVPGSKAMLGMGHYKQEVLQIPGPVTQLLSVYIVTRADATFTYSMALPTQKKRIPEFKWDFLDWSLCSSSCGLGIKTSTPKCVETGSGIVEDVHCKDLKKPEPKKLSCENVPCKPEWFIGDWQKCSPCSNCKTKKCVRTRMVRCMQITGDAPGTNKIVPNSECKEVKPPEEIDCECPKQQRESYKIQQSHLCSKCESFPFYGYHEEIGDSPALSMLFGKEPQLKGNDQKRKKGDVMKDKHPEIELTIHLEEGIDIELPPGVKKPPKGTKKIVLKGDDAIKYLKMLKKKP